MDQPFTLSEDSLWAPLNQHRLLVHWDPQLEQPPYLCYPHEIFLFLFLFLLYFLILNFLKKFCFKFPFARIQRGARQPGPGTFLCFLFIFDLWLPTYITLIADNSNLINSSLLCLRALLFLKFLFSFLQNFGFLQFGPFFLFSKIL